MCNLNQRYDVKLEKSGSIRAIHADGSVWKGTNEVWSSQAEFGQEGVLQALLELSLSERNK
ncbi:hypothetical protein GCM10026988_22330 [Vibrio panuliri]|uniref:Uncharacterized protein n=1 Tax=Vibrio panuliri TaxID=1381081 RepID=A0ABX3FGF5_9VIBR|nr:hypothetical protein BIY20_08790 [Vibrio panuliri]